MNRRTWLSVPRGVSPRSASQLTTPRQRSLSQPGGGVGAPRQRSKDRSSTTGALTSIAPTLGQPHGASSASRFTVVNEVPEHVMRYVQLHTVDTRIDLEQEEFAEAVFCGRQVHGQIDGVAVRYLARVMDTVWVGEKGGAVSIWAFEDATPIHRIERFGSAGHVTCISEVRAHGDSQQSGRAWVGYSDGMLRVFGVNRSTAASTSPPQILFQVKDHSGAIVVILPSFNSHFVFTASRDFMILRWDASTYKKVASLPGHRNGVNCLAIQGIRLFSGGDDNRVLEWDVTRCKPVKSMKGHTASVRCMAVCGDTLWTGSDDGSVRLWNIHLTTPAAQKPNPAVNNNSVNTTHQSLDQTAIADDALLVGAGAKASHHHTYPCIAVLSAPHSGPVTQLELVGARMWSCSFGTVFVWDVETHALTGQYHDHETGHLTAVKVLHTSAISRVWTCSSDGSVIMWNIESQFSRAARALQTVSKLDNLVVGSYEREAASRKKYEAGRSENATLQESLKSASDKIAELEAANKALSDKLARSHEALQESKETIAQLEARLCIPASGQERFMKLLVEQICRPESILPEISAAPITTWSSPSSGGNLLSGTFTPSHHHNNNKASMLSQNEHSIVFVVEENGDEQSSAAAADEEDDSTPPEQKLQDQAMRELLLELSVVRLCASITPQRAVIPAHIHPQPSPFQESNTVAVLQDKKNDLSETIAALADALPVSSSAKADADTAPAYAVVDTVAMSSAWTSIVAELQSLQKNLSDFAQLSNPCRKRTIFPTTMHLLLSLPQPRQHDGK